MSTPEQRLSMARDIINFEARRDRAGHLSVYHLPANDGGGRYEVAGINERYNGPQVRKLVELLGEGKYDEAETYAEEYIAENTDSAELLTHVPRIESYLRDSVFNRGQRGAVKILQIALGVAVDGAWGPQSKAAMAKAEKNPDALLLKLRTAREYYERRYVGYRANFWRGLVNRWNSALRVAKSYPAEMSADPIHSSSAGDDYGTIKTVVEKPSALGSILHAPRLGAPKSRRRRQRR